MGAIKTVQEMISANGVKATFQELWQKNKNLNNDLQIIRAQMRAKELEIANNSKLALEFINNCEKQGIGDTDNSKKSVHLIHEKKVRFMEFDSFGNANSVWFGKRKINTIE